MKNCQIVRSTSTSRRGLFSKKLLMLLLVLFTVKDDLTFSNNNMRNNVANAYYIGKIRGVPNQASLNSGRKIGRILRSYFDGYGVTNKAEDLGLLNRVNRNAGRSIFQSSNLINGGDYGENENSIASLISDEGALNKDANPAQIKQILTFLKTKKFRWCGSELPNVLSLMCRGVYYDGTTNSRFRRQVLGLDNGDDLANNYADQTDIDDPDSIIYDKKLPGASLIANGGAAQKCCLNSCTYLGLLKFCAKRPDKASGAATEPIKSQKQIRFFS